MPSLADPPTPPADLRLVDGPERTPVSFAKVLAHRPAGPDGSTSVDAHGVRLASWTPPRGAVRRYTDVVGGTAVMPLAFPALIVTRLFRDLMGAGGLPVSGMGLVHVGTALWTSGRLPASGGWEVDAWADRSRHTRSGMEIDLAGRVKQGEATWTLRMPVLARSRRASGTDESAVPRLPPADQEWTTRTQVEATSGIGREYARLSGDFNPIHLHELTARPFGFRRAIAHGWWAVPRALAVLGVDETPVDERRRLDVAYARPVLLPSRLTLNSRTDRDGDGARTTFLTTGEEDKAAFGGVLTAES